MKNIFKKKVILVTGGCGSIGSEIVRQLLKYSPKQIRVFDNKETEQFYLQRDLKQHSDILTFLLGDVRDKERLIMAMEGVDIVFHAAALKHVPLCEYNPFEAVKTNVFGTQNVIEASLMQCVEKVINISTDKVTHTINTMGATKLLSERLITSAQYYKGKKKTLFSSVRFGNVFGSNGSIVKLFERQILAGQDLTITHPEMTRFVMSIPQAVSLVLKAAIDMVGGEIFILKMPVFKLKDFVEVVVEELSFKHGVPPDKIKAKKIGLRRGERMYEYLMTEEESANAVEDDLCLIVLPAKTSSWFGIKDFKKYKKMKKTLKKRYCSDDLTPLTKESLRKLILKEKLL